jgi:uncharacterized protein with von Willebrand factor type A (vWA) domain
LRFPARTGPKTEIDLDATIQEVAATGHFLLPSLQKRLENATDLRFLIDRDGSMVPFHGLCTLLHRRARTVGQIPRVDVRYFHDCPVPQVFRRAALMQAQNLEEWLLGLDRKRSLVVVVSDAGAARGNMDAVRIAATAEFLEALQQHCCRLVWLNPMPRGRWKGNSAEAIAGMVPMFEANAQGLQLAVDCLRGKTVPSFSNLPGLP